VSGKIHDELAKSDCGRKGLIQAGQGQINAVRELGVGCLQKLTKISKTADAERSVSKIEGQEPPHTQCPKWGGGIGVEKTFPFITKGRREGGWV